MQALQISDLNINPLITQPLCPLQFLFFFFSKKSIAMDGFRTPNIKPFFYYGEQLGYIENTSLIICSQDKLRIYFSQAQKGGYLWQAPTLTPVLREDFGTGSPLHKILEICNCGKQF